MLNRGQSQLTLHRVSSQESEPLPTKEKDLSPTGQRILRHWKEFRPKYVESLQQKNHLYQTVEQAAIDHWRTVSGGKSQGLAHDQAQEPAREAWIHPTP